MGSLFRYQPLSSTHSSSTLVGSRLIGDEDDGLSSAGIQPRAPCTVDSHSVAAELHHSLVLVCVCGGVFFQRSEDRNRRELVLSFHHAGSRDETQVVRPVTFIC